MTTLTMSDGPKLVKMKELPEGHVYTVNFRHYFMKVSSCRCVRLGEPDRLGLPQYQEAFSDDRIVSDLGHLTGITVEHPSVSG